MGDADTELAAVLASYSRDLLARTDADLVLQAASGGFPATLGYDTGRLVGLELPDLTHPEDRPVVLAAASAVRTRGRPASRRIRLRHADGSDVPVELTIAPHGDGLVISAADRRDIEAAEQRASRRSALLRTLSSLTVPLATAPLDDANDVIERLLAECAGLLGVDRAWLLGAKDAHGSVSLVGRWERDGMAPLLDGLLPAERSTVIRAVLARHHRSLQVRHGSLPRSPGNDPLAQHLSTRGVTWLATAPLYHEGRWLGLLGLDAVHEPATWALEDDELVNGIVTIVANTLARFDRDRSMERNRELLAMAGRVAHFGGWRWDVESRTTTWSDELCALLELPPGDHPSFETLLERCHPGDRCRVQAAHDAAVTQGQDWDLEFRLGGPDGTLRWVRSIGTVERDRDGHTIRLWGAIQDVTERYAAQHVVGSLTQQLATTLERVHDAVLLLDRDGRVTYVNDQACELLGLPRRELVGLRLVDALPEQRDSVFHVAEQESLRDGRHRQVTGFFSPRSRWLEASFTAMDDGLSLFIRDVTARIEREHMLQRVAEAERRGAAELRQLDEVRSAFLTAVSHELRTPLAVIYGMAETLTRLREHPSDVDRDQLEDRLLVHARRLTDLVDELVTLERLSRGGISISREPTDVVAVVRALLSEASREGRPVAARVQVDAPDHLVALIDPRLVDGVVRNLLGNVEKYAPDGPVKVSLATCGDGGLVLAVADEGPGIPAEERDRVFNPFVRLHRDSPSPGTGVGLTLVREFAKLHGGRAWVEQPDESPGRGTRVVVELPAPSR